MLKCRQAAANARDGPDQSGTAVLVAGVDGCRGGWLVLRAFVVGDRLSAAGDAVVVRDFEAVLALTAAAAAVGVDMPIGLGEDGPREADREARRYLGRPAASSVFPAPVRPALAAQDYRQACALSLAACGRSLGKQTFNLVAKIREVDAALTPSDQERIFESHPEVCFKALNAGCSLSAGKRSPAGRELREGLLARIYESDPARWPLPAGAARDDLYDAAVLAWTAARAVLGRAERLPASPPRDGRGLRMEIVY